MVVIVAVALEAVSGRTQISGNPGVFIEALRASLLVPRALHPPVTDVWQSVIAVRDLHHRPNVLRLKYRAESKQQLQRMEQLRATSAISHERMSIELS